MARAYRSKGDPWPRGQSDGPGGHSAEVCPGNLEPQGSPGAGFHCGQSAPIAYENVFKWGGEKQKMSNYGRVVVFLCLSVKFLSKACKHKPVST